MNDYDELRHLAEVFFDAQEARKAMESKIRSAGDPLFFSAAIAHYRAVEEEMSKALKKCMRRPTFAAILKWQKQEAGIGEHLLARLLGATGNPRLKTPKHWEGRGHGDRILVADDPSPRTVGQLWSYCGHGDPTRVLHKGMTAEEVLQVGNKRTKAIVWNIAESCLKAGVRKSEADTDVRIGISHYGDVYLKRRKDTAERVHATDCVRCGPAGKPALIGSPWSKAHQHADALRIVGKEVLRDLWLAAE